MRKIIFLLLMVLVISIESVNAQLADSPWPTLHGTNKRSGLSPYDTSHVDGTIKWKFEAGGGIEGSPSIGEDGTIYFGSHDGYLYAITEEGKLKWKTKIGTPSKVEDYDTIKSTISTPTISSDGVIYILSHDQHLYAINPDGTEKWKFPITFNTDNWASPAVGDDGTIYITTYQPKGGVYAINPDGTEKWHYGETFTTCGSVTIGEDGTIYAGFQLKSGSSDHELLALNPDGTKKWGVKTTRFLESSLAIAPDGTIYASSYNEAGTEEGTDAGVYAISNQQIKWHYDTPNREVMSTPAIGPDGTIYVGGYDNHIFYAINPDGTGKWSFETPGKIGSSPSVGADGTIYIGSDAFATDEAGFYALNPDGTLKWKALVNQGIISSPAIGADGTVYVTSWDQHLYAFGGPGEGKLTQETTQPERGPIQPPIKEQPTIEPTPTEGMPLIYVIIIVIVLVAVIVFLILKKRIL